MDLTDIYKTFHLKVAEYTTRKKKKEKHMKAKQYGIEQSIDH